MTVSRCLIILESAYKGNHFLTNHQAFSEKSLLMFGQSNNFVYFCVGETATALEDEETDNRHADADHGPRGLCCHRTGGGGARQI